MHLKRYSMPKYWGLSVKKEKFVVAPRGSHPKESSIPMRVVLRDLLKLADTSAEAASILNQGKILVDKKVRKDPRFSVGIMDVIEIPELKKAYRIDTDKRGLYLRESKTPEKKLCKIKGKTVIKGGHEQLNLHDGRNIIVGKKSPYKVGDTVEISLTENKILERLPLRKGSSAIVIGGKNIGNRGKITSVPQRKFMLEKAIVGIEINKKKIETIKDYIFVTGKGD